jgi:outer membrane lipoprotein-sorting protein
MRSPSSFFREFSLLLIWGAAVALLPLAPAAADEPKPDDPSPQQILDRMAKGYAGCKTYRDSGVVRTAFFEDTRNRIVEKPFTTAFVRPDRFRFEYKETQTSVWGMRQSRYIVWSDGKAVQTWWDVGARLEKPESLDLALAGATGVSGGSAHTIPALLLPDKVSGRRLTNITELRRAEDGKLEKVECFRIEGKYADVPITLWIDKKSYLVRRIDEQEKFDNFRTEEATTYEPIIDEKITDEMLEFAPPVQK